MTCVRQMIGRELVTEQTPVARHSAQLLSRKVEANPEEYENADWDQ
jgi:hypothetical protein